MAQAKIFSGPASIDWRTAIEAAEPDARRVLRKYAYLAAGMEDIWVPQQAIIDAQAAVIECLKADRDRDKVLRELEQALETAKAKA